MLKGCERDALCLLVRAFYTSGDAVIELFATCSSQGCLRFMQAAQQEEESKADDEALQMVLKRLKALEQENDGPERRELLRRRKKQLKEVLSHHKGDCAQAQLPALQKRFEQEVRWMELSDCPGFMHPELVEDCQSVERS